MVGELDPFSLLLVKPWTKERLLYCLRTSHVCCLLVHNMEAYKCVAMPRHVVV